MLAPPGVGLLDLCRSGASEEDRARHLRRLSKSSAEMGPASSASAARSAASSSGGAVNRVSASLATTLTVVPLTNPSGLSGTMTPFLTVPAKTRMPRVYLDRCWQPINNSTSECPESRSRLGGAGSHHVAAPHAGRLREGADLPGSAARGGNSGAAARRREQGRSTRSRCCSRTLRGTGRLTLNPSSWYACTAMATPAHRKPTTLD